MPVAYSLDLRKRVIDSISDNMHIDKAVKIFKISRKTIYLWQDQYKKTGNIIAKSGYQKGHSHKIKDWNQFKIFVEKNKCSSAEKMSIEWQKMTGTKVSKSVIYKGLRKIGYTSKKKLLTTLKQIR